MGKQGARDQAAVPVISADGTTIAIGGYGHDTPASGAGAIWIMRFDTSSNEWKNIGTLLGKEQSEHIGGQGRISLTPDGNCLAYSPLRSGAVRVFDYDGSTWTQAGIDIELPASHGGERSNGGIPSLNGDGTVVATGMFYMGIRSGGPGNKAGGLLIYKRDASNTWTRQGQIIDGDGYGDNLGRQIKISRDGQTIIASAIFGKNPSTNDKPGYIKAYTWDASTSLWKQLGQTIWGDQNGARIGSSLDASADCKMFISSSPYYSNPATFQYVGLVMVFELKNDQWVQVGDRFYGEGAKARYGGLGLALSGDGSVFAMSQNSDVHGANTGSVRVYQRTSSGWEKVGRDLEGENARDWFGSFHVDMSDNARLIVGSQYHNRNTGKAYVYSTSA